MLGSGIQRVPPELSFRPLAQVSSVLAPSEAGSLSVAAKMTNVVPSGFISSQALIPGKRGCLFPRSLWQQPQGFRALARPRVMCPFLSQSPSPGEGVLRLATSLAIWRPLKSWGGELLRPVGDGGNPGKLLRGQKKRGRGKYAWHFKTAWRLKVSSFRIFTI